MMLVTESQEPGLKVARESLREAARMYAGAYLISGTVGVPRNERKATLERMSHILSHAACLYAREVGRQASLVRKAERENRKTKKSGGRR